MNYRTLFKLLIIIKVIIKGADDWNSLLHYYVSEWVSEWVFIVIVMSQYLQLITAQKHHLLKLQIISSINRLKWWNPIGIRGTMLGCPGNIYQMDSSLFMMFPPFRQQLHKIRISHGVPQGLCLDYWINLNTFSQLCWCQSAVLSMLQYWWNQRKHNS